MTEKEIIEKLLELLLLPKETEWLEFKQNNAKPSEIGEYISSLSNSACLHKKDKAFLVFGVEDGIHKVVGTDFNPTTEKVGNEELENWLDHLLDPKNDFKIFMFRLRGKPIVVFSIDPAENRPVKFSGTAYIHVGSYKKSSLTILKRKVKYGAVNPQMTGRRRCAMPPQSTICIPRR